MQFDRGYISPYFITNAEKMVADLEDPFILLHEKKLSGLQPMLPLLETVVQSGRPLLIIAEDIEGEALATLVVNRLRGGLKVAAVKAPGFGDRRKAMLEDIAILTGGQVVSRRISASSSRTSRIDMLGNGEEGLDHQGRDHHRRGRRQEGRHLRAAATRSGRRSRRPASDYDREKLQERLAKLAGGVAVIRVGGATEVEVKERRDRVDDAMNATRAAVEEGIVPGGGTALLQAPSANRSRSSLRPKTTTNRSASTSCGKRDFRRRCARSPRTPASRARSWSASCSKARTRRFRLRCRRPSTYTDLVKSGIIDPTKVVRATIAGRRSLGRRVS